MSKNPTYPWGTGETLTEGENYRVKRISLNLKSRQSYQTHKKRAEAWLIVSGEGKITLDDEITIVGPTDIGMIGIGVKHRIENTHTTDDLIFIETQLGTYFGEDDITRYEDDYGRHHENWTREDDASLYD